MTWRSCLTGSRPRDRNGPGKTGGRWRESGTIRDWGLSDFRWRRCGVDAKMCAEEVTNRAWLHPLPSILCWLKERSLSLFNSTSLPGDSCCPWIVKFLYIFPCSSENSMDIFRIWAMSPHQSNLGKLDSRSKATGSQSCLRHTEREPGSGQWLACHVQAGFPEARGGTDHPTGDAGWHHEDRQHRMSAASNVLKIPALPSPDPTCYGNHALGRSLAFFFSFFTFLCTIPRA